MSDERDLAPWLRTQAPRRLDVSGARAVAGRVSMKRLRPVAEKKQKKLREGWFSAEAFRDEVVRVVGLFVSPPTSEQLAKVLQRTNGYLCQVLKVLIKEGRLSREKRPANNRWEYVYFVPKADS